MIGTTQLFAIFAFGLVISGSVVLGIMRANEFTKRELKEKQRDE